MNPKAPYVYSPRSLSRNLPKLLVRLSVFLVVIGVLVFGVVLYRNYTRPFGITGTTPNVNDMTTQTRSMTINFSHPILQGSASVTSTPSIITASSVSGSKLNLTLAAKKMVSDKAYVITIQSISPTRGKQLTNQRLVFTPSFVPPQRVGEQGLLTAGLSTPQLDKINQHIATFSPWAQKVIVDQSNINYYPIDPNDTLGLWGISFLVQIDETPYRAIGYFYDVTDLQLKLFDPTTSQQLFVAGSPDAN